MSASAAWPEYKNAVDKSDHTKSTMHRVQWNWKFFMPVVLSMLVMLMPEHTTATPITGNFSSQSEQLLTARIGVTGRSSATARLLVELRVASGCEISLHSPKSGDVTARLICTPASTAWTANATPRNSMPKSFVPFELHDLDNFMQAVGSPNWLQHDTIFQLDY